MEISIKGHSGCKVSIQNKNEITFVSKTSPTKKYNTRLLKQALKQSYYAENLDINDIIVPSVLNFYDNNHLYYFDMEYFKGIDSISYFNRCGTEEIEKFANLIIKFLQTEISLSNYKLFNKELFINKYYEVMNNLNNIIEIDSYKIESYFNKLPIIKIPNGVCHGDLTLSNVLFSSNGNKICIFDFLDTFYETPLQDIVKLRQDTKFHWTMQLYNKDYDKVRNIIVLSYLDKVILRTYSRFHFYKTYYRAFQIINYLRILQYSKNTKIKIYLIENINQMVKLWI